MNTFIFDLDGTLLPMPSQELFLEAYFKALYKKLLPYNIDAKKLYKAVWAGLAAMVENDGSVTNEQRFWDIFCGVFGEEVRKLEPVLMDFYQNEFDEARCETSTNPLADKCIKRLKEKGYCAVLATNPVFPKVATLTRIRWAGLDPQDFELITTYENSSYCKPNLDYYREVLHIIEKQPKECIMVGNDIKEDMCTESLGMDTFLMKDCLINTEKADISRYHQGGFVELMDMIEKLPDLS